MVVGSRLGAGLNIVMEGGILLVESGKRCRMLLFTEYHLPPHVVFALSHYFPTFFCSCLVCLVLTLPPSPSYLLFAFKLSIPSSSLLFYPCYSFLPSDFLSLLLRPSLSSNSAAFCRSLNFHLPSSLSANYIILFLCHFFFFLLFNSVLFTSSVFLYIF